MTGRRDPFGEGRVISRQAGPHSGWPEGRLELGFCAPGAQNPNWWDKNFPVGFCAPAQKPGVTTTGNMPKLPEGYSTTTKPLRGSRSTRREAPPAAARTPAPQEKGEVEKPSGGRPAAWFALGVVALLSAVSYANSLPNGFVFDDEYLIFRNELIKSLRNLPTILASHYWAGPGDAMVQSFPANLYRPLVVATFAFNYAVGGLNPVGYHLVNVLIHIAVCFALYELALRIGWSPGAALAAAALFAAHPLHTEAVTGIVGRSELLMALGVLLALHWYLRGGVPSRLSPRYALASWGGFLAALLSKEQAMVLPALLLLSDLTVEKGPGWWRRLIRSAWRRYVGYGMVLAAFLAVRVAVLGRFFEARTALPFLDNPAAHAPWYPRLLTAIKVAGKYLWLFVWPDKLSADYSYNAIPLVTSIRDPGVLAALAAWGILVGLAAFSFLQGRRHGFFAVGLAGLAFLPASNLLIPIGTIMGERLFYLPSAGLCLLIGVGWDRVREWARQTGRLRMLTRGGVVALGLVLVPLTLRTIVRNRDWRDNKQIMESASRVVPQSAKVMYNLGLTQEDPARALLTFEAAIRIYPDYLKTNGDANGGYGSALLRVGRVAESIEPLERAVALRPRIKGIHYNLGLAYLKEGRVEDAETAYRKELALNEGSAGAYNGLSFALRKQDRFEEAMAAADEAIRLKPDMAEAHYNRGQALEGLGRVPEAVASYERALEVKPDLSLAKSRLERLRRHPRR